MNITKIAFARMLTAPKTIARTPTTLRILLMHLTFFWYLAGSKVDSWIFGTPIAEY